jgi:hypothetical protein
MTAKDAILHTMGMSDRILNSYLGDLSDADLLIRPVEGQNHIAWQLGHLISSERWFVEALRPGSCPPLPEGFDAAHNRDATTSDDPARFLPKQKYVDLYQAQRAATRAVLDSLTDADLDAPGPERARQIAPTVGATFALMGEHVIMHSGQFVSVRRKLKKPVVI